MCHGMLARMGVLGVITFAIALNLASGQEPAKSGVNVPPPAPTGSPTPAPAVIKALPPAQTPRPVLTPAPRELIDSDVIPVPMGRPSPPLLSFPEIAIDPKTPLADLLPKAPKLASRPKTLFQEDLAGVPEVTFQDPLARNLASRDSAYKIAHQLAKIRHLNAKSSDAFMQALIEQRADLSGMPFAMGETCRTIGRRASFLAFFSAAIRQSLAGASDGNSADLLDADKFWATLAKTLQPAEAEMASARRAREQDDFEAARVAAMIQVLAPESAALRLGLVKHLSKTPHVQATKALAQMSLFSAEDEVRQAAVKALKIRREQDYLGILMDGFRYPLPQVAKRAAEALVQLDCKEVVPRLVELLDEPDPRLPATKVIEGKAVTQVSEIVRVNHHRNCILCHAPADSQAENAVSLNGGAFFDMSGATTKSTLVSVTKEIEEKSAEGTKMKTVTETVPMSVTTGIARPSLVAPIPLPNEPLPSLADGSYGVARSSDTMVRIDVTYLHQDFSMLMPVYDAGPWPAMQRFDFFVRQRTVSAEEAVEYRKNAPKTGAGSPTPYQRTVLYALRELTQRDTGPTSQAWRELLAVPQKAGMR